MGKDNDMKDILRMMEQVAGQTAPAVAPEVWRQRLAAGRPALGEKEFPVSDAAVLLTAAVGVMGGGRLEKKQAEDLVIRYMADRVSDDCWRELGLKREMGILCLHLACQTALARIAKAVAGAVRLEAWHESQCPVCGGSPAFACLDGEGRRLLVCEACLHRWRFKRIGCTGCGEERPERLKILYSDEFTGWSASVCLSCRGYIKTADLRKLAAAPVWQIAAVETLPLDYAISGWQASTHNRIN